MSAPKPIKLTQIDAGDYAGPEPKPYVVVGPVPGGGGGGAVDSVNGKTGTVVLVASDVGAAGITANNTFTGMNTFEGVSIMPGAAVISVVQVGTLAGTAAVAIKDDGSFTQVLADSSQSIITFPDVADDGVIATQEWVAANAGVPVISPTSDLNDYTASGAFIVVQDSDDNWPANFPTIDAGQGANAPALLTTWGINYDDGNPNSHVVSQSLSIPFGGAGSTIIARSGQGDSYDSLVWGSWSELTPALSPRTNISIVTTSPYSIGTIDDGAILFANLVDGVEFTLHNTGNMATTVVDPNGTSTFTSDSAISTIAGKQAKPIGQNARIELLGLDGNWLLSGDLADETP